MKCAVCRKGETTPGVTTVTLERNGLTVVFKGVPAQVCANCGEDYVDVVTAIRLETLAGETERNGTQVEIRQYVAA